MNSPAASRFLTRDEVLLIHADQISLYGGSAGIRDEGLLASALAQPEATADGQYLHDSLASQAAAYLFHLVKNHPFIDGNKRVGTATALVFLDMNGHELDAALDEFDGNSQQTRLELVVIRVASGGMTKDELTTFIGNHLRPLQDEDLSGDRL
jgi:death on curing protein